MPPAAKRSSIDHGRSYQIGAERRLRAMSQLRRQYVYLGADCPVLRTRVTVVEMPSSRQIRVPDPAQGILIQLQGESNAEQS
jgi:hypothetical protein